jgi:hypothetical protein
VWTPAGNQVAGLADQDLKGNGALSGVTEWRLHDLRRTCVSGMARLGVAPVADKILDPQAGAIPRVAAVYQRHEFLAERRAALNLWEAMSTSF